MLIFTNRALAAGADESIFTKTFAPGSSRLALATVERGASGAAARWKVSQPDDDVDDADALRALLPLFQGARPVLVYLHGGNNTPAKCFERCARLASLYDVEVIGFSWASEGSLADGTDLPGVAGGRAGDESDLGAVTPENRTDAQSQRRIRCYHQAKINAQDSVDALARFLRMVGTARLYANAQPFTLAAHSLGVHFLQYALAVSTAAESLGTAHNVALLAPCARASGHRDWLARVRPKGQVFVTYNKGDNVLFGAYVADGYQLKLGADPTGELLVSGAVRYISFTRAPVGLGGHRYFALDTMPRKSLKLFQRIFRSQADLQHDEYPRQIYPVGCDADGLTCYMGASGQAGGG